MTQVKVGPLWVPEHYADDAEEWLYWANRARNGTPEQRRAICENHPILFALVYFSHLLRSPETNNELSLCQFHIDMFLEARQWRYPWGPTEYRVGWVGPREIGKTTISRILLIGVLAFRFRMVVVYFTGVAKRGRQRLADIKREFRTNKYLRLDFPDLCEPGTGEVDNSSEYISAGGHAIAVNGFDESVLGFQSLNLRPQVLWLDDIEKTGARYSAGEKDKRLRMVKEQIFPMNINAIVVMVGTVTRYGSMMHEIVQYAAGGERADWITEEHMDCRYYPAIVVNRRTGLEESLWENRWSWAFIQSYRHTDNFLLGWMNQPIASNAGFWKTEDYQYGFPWLIDFQILAIDPAVKSEDQNDPSGIAIVGFDASKLHAVVQFAEAVRLDPDGMRTYVKWLLDNNPSITHIVIEDNNGGDYLSRNLRPIVPSHIKIVQVFEPDSKAICYKELHDWYQLGWIWHVAGLIALEQQQRSYPDVDHDDIIDAVTKAVRYHLRNRPLPVAA
jgi:hypothetical protein